jgi:formylglycine-generating enzyme required for sulfatase activity
MQRTAGIGRAIARVLFALAAIAATANTTRAEHCIADVNLDGSVLAQDLALLLSDWGRPASAGLATDIDGSGVVDANDLAIMLGAWGTCVKVPAWADLIEPSPDPAVVTDPALRAAIVASGTAWRVRDHATGIEMLLVPKGTFMMGASAGDSSAWLDENPRHAVTISRPFYIGRYEVTQPEFLAVTGYNPSFFTQADDGDIQPLPVETVSFVQIQGFLAATGLRLPTEAEWEFACRAGSESPTYASGSQETVDLAWYAPNSGFVTHPVGDRAPNALGLHDMLGNVWEWTADWHDSLYYASSPAIDPPGPSAGAFKVIRGGSWYAPSQNTRSSFRGAVWPQATFGDTGFRVVRNP